MIAFTAALKEVLGYFFILNTGALNYQAGSAWLLQFAQVG
jgi:hypothetical protein